MTVKIKNTYQITVIRDGVKSSDHYYDHAIEAVEAWIRFSDYGDATNNRTIMFIPPTGEIRTKSFLRK